MTSEVNKQAMNDDDEYYTLVPEQGLCLIDDVILNLRQISAIRKEGDKTLVFCPGQPAPLTLPASAFQSIKDAVFAMDELDDEFDLDDDDDEEEEDN